jgi:hypothetical protein
MIVIVAVIAGVIVSVESCFIQLVVLYLFQLALPLTWVNRSILFFLTHRLCVGAIPNLNSRRPMHLDLYQKPKQICHFESR